MSTSLLELTPQLLTSEVVDRLATFTGETPAATEKALGGAAPAVLAGMLQTAQEPDGLSRLVNLLQQGKFDGTMLDNLPAAYSGSSLDGLMMTGGPLLGSIFGARSNRLVDLLSGQAGVKRTSAMALLSAAAPFVMSLVGRQLLTRGAITPAAVKDLLLSQRDAITSAVPPGLAPVLGTGDIGGTSAAAARPGASPGSSTTLRRLLPLLLVTVALVLLFVLLRSCGGSRAVTTPPTDTTRTLGPSIDSTTQAAGMPRTTTSVPSPGVLAIATRPPQLSTSRFTIESPRPDPLVFVEKWGSKTRGSASAGMPEPSSSTTMRPGSMATRTMVAPALRAFSSTLISTSFSSSARARPVSARGASRTTRAPASERS